MRVAMLDVQLPHGLHNAVHYLLQSFLGVLGGTAAAPQQERTQPPMPVIEGTISGIDNSAPIAGSCVD
jgi:hypothetical protein